VLVFACVWTGETKHVRLLKEQNLHQSDKAIVAEGDYSPSCYSIAYSLLLNEFLSQDAGSLESTPVFVKTSLIAIACAL